MTTTRETEEEGEGGMVSRRESASTEKSEFSEVKEKGKLYHILCNSEHPSCTCACVCFNERLYTFILHSRRLCYIPVAVPFWI